MNAITSSVSNIYKLDGRVPLPKAIPFGLQHVLAMFVSNLAPISIIAAAAGLAQPEIAILLQNAMFAVLRPPARSRQPVMVRMIRC